MQQDWEGNVLRSKGYFWLASRHDIAGTWSQAGGIVRHGPAGYWWSVVPQEKWPQDESDVASIKAEFFDDYGDRRQELVFIGQHLDRDAITRRLDACLLDDEEYSQGPAVWQAYHDPLPNWAGDWGATVIGYPCHFCFRSLPAPRWRAKASTICCCG